MSLGPGVRIGAFEVIAKLGEGGMGQVFRARDTRLDRDVALKVIPDLFTSDPDRLARFEREAKLLASLNHPNIAQVFGFESNAIAMELVEGQTLDELIASGHTEAESASAARRESRQPVAPGVGPRRNGASRAPRGLNLDDALSIARQIAAALEAAHDQGIVHRDLKPANVKLREDGTVKVLDFGLAKAFAADAESSMSGVANSPTLTARATQMGMILGTAAYMAPEQAKGRAVDRRADVWAFGAVLFEMLSGRRAFEGDDVAEVLAAVLKTEPDWSALPAGLPSAVRRLLRRCLEKDPKKRLRDVGEGMLQLDEALTSAGASAGQDANPEVRSSPKALWRRALPVAAAVALTAAAAYGLQLQSRPEPPLQSAVRFVFETAPNRMTISNGRRDLAISPDGRIVAYSAATVSAPAIILRRLDQPEPVPLRGAEAAQNPFISSDGQWLGFLSTDDQITVKKVPIGGGPPLIVSRLPGTMVGGTWTSDGSIVVGVADHGLLRLPQSGGTERLTTLDKAAQEENHIWPSAVPGTSLVLFVLTGGGPSPISAGKLAVLDLSDKRIVRLGIVGTNPRYISSGHIVYATSDGALHAVRFDPKSISVSGGSLPVAETVGVKTSGAANFDVSDDGRLIYAGGNLGPAAIKTVAWADRSGKETPIAAQPRNYFYARIAPDGKRLSLDVRDQEEDVWIWDIERDTMSRLTDKPGADQYGLWMPDGRLVFASASFGRLELAVHRSDGVGQPKQITDTKAEGLTPFPNAVTPDGKQVIFRSAVNGKNDLFIVDIDGDRKVRTLLSTEHDERNAALSPDGKFMAFESDLSSKWEVYVRPFPDVQTRQWQVSTAGGSKPVWSPTGREIFYLSADGKLMAVPVSVTPELALGRPTALFDASPYHFGGQGRNYDVTRDGKRFVLVKNPPAAGGVLSVPITVIVNWVDELKQRLR